MAMMDMNDDKMMMQDNTNDNMEKMMDNDRDDRYGKNDGS